MTGLSDMKITHAHPDSERCGCIYLHTLKLAAMTKWQMNLLTLWTSAYEIYD